MPKIKKYYPASEIQVGFYANPGEFVLKDGTEYVGLYCQVGNQLISGTRPGKNSQFLYKATTQHKSERNQAYYKITKREYDKHIAPEYFIPQPTTKEYQAGQFTRYVAQKINEPDKIIEISESAARAANAKNRPGINTTIYRIIDVPWVITGQAAAQYNNKTLQLKEIIYPGIRAYFSDLTEFLK